MNIKRVIKKSNLEDLIASLTKVIPLSLCIKDKNKKTIISISNTDKNPSVSYPIRFKDEAIAELNISEGGHIAEYILQLINNAFIKEGQIADISDETLLMYQEVNLHYDLSTTIDELEGLDGHLDFLMKKCADNIQAENASIWLLKDIILQCTHSIGFEPKRTFKLGEGVLGKVAIYGSSEVLNNPIEDYRWSGENDEVTSVIMAMMKTKQKRIGVFLVSKKNRAPFTAKDLKIANVFAHRITLEIENNRLLIKVKEDAILQANLSRYLSPNVAELLAKQKQELTLGGEKKIISVLFSDIVSFTNLSEHLDSEIIVEMLNEYFTSMTKIIFKLNGTLDKFIGDAIMAIFGVPNDIENHAKAAVETGILMQKANTEIQHNRRIKGKPDFLVRIGIETGLATVGNIGSPNRLDYTAIGDIVNVASRIESAALPGGVLIGESTFTQVKDFFKIENLQPIKVKGKAKPIKVYKVLE